VNCSELHSFLERTGRRPNRSLSQNFLVDENIARKIVRTADVASGDQVLEIGPGPGALTVPLLEAGARVIAVEADPVFAKELGRLEPQERCLNPVFADFLTFPLSPLLAPMKVVANLPYHITTPILEKLFEHRDRFTTLTLMVQKELVDRMFAPPGSKSFGSLSLFTQFHTELAASFLVSAACFYPKPTVDSKVIHLALRTPPLEESALFFSLVRRAFQQRRKMIRVSLASLYPVQLLEQALAAAGARTDARPETLSLEQWIAFFRSATKVRSG